MNTFFLGCNTFGNSKPWMLSKNQSLLFLKEAASLNITHFDTANCYSNGLSEEILGESITHYFNRQEVFLSTKVFNQVPRDNITQGLSKSQINKAIDCSLHRLKTDYVDLYQIHNWDASTPIEETLETLNNLVTLGKVKAIGASNLTKLQLEKSLQISQNNNWVKFTYLQIHYNLIYQDNYLVNWCNNNNIKVLAWSPLARGFLSTHSSLRRLTDDLAKSLYFKPKDYLIKHKVTKLASKYNISNCQIALAWLNTKNVIPIIGATKLDYLKETLYTNIKLTLEDLNYLND